MTEGWIYCLSNPSMPGILKVGMTDKTPEERAKVLFTTGVPSPFKVEFAKKVAEPKVKEGILHKLLEKYVDKIYPRREFFRVGVEEVTLFFQLIDGEWWSEMPLAPEPLLEEFEQTTATLSNCFTSGQRIRHKYGINTWIATYDTEKDRFVRGEKLYASPKEFVLSHMKTYKPEDKLTNGWQSCECEMNNKWVPIYFS
jgi:hypothetical protein